MLAEIICQQSEQLWDFRQTNNFIFRKREVKRYGKYDCIKKSVCYYA